MNAGHLAGSEMVGLEDGGVAVGDADAAASGMETVGNVSHRYELCFSVVLGQNTLEAVGSHLLVEALHGHCHAVNIE